MQAFRFFLRFILRPLRRDPLRAALMALAIALGVAVVLAIELAGQAAAGSFHSSVETLTGDADFEVSAPGGIPASAAGVLLRLPYSLDVRPRIEDFAEVPRIGRVVPFLGVDMVANAIGGEGDLEDLDTGHRIWLGVPFHKKRGDRIQLLIGDRTIDFTVQGTLAARNGEVAVVDLSLADALLHRQGRLDRILVRVPAGRSIGEWQSILRSSLPAGAVIEPQGARTRENRKMLEAFRWNLRVLSYIALVVGAFLIYNTISVSVVRRRAEIGILRALGATRATVLAAFLGEAGFFGLTGGLLGIALGRLMAEGALRLVAATVDSLYVSSTPAPIVLTAQSMILALVVGVGVTLVSGLAPAREAALVSPVEAMARGRVDYRSRVHKLRDLLLAALFGLAAALASQAPSIGGKPLFGYLAAILLVAAGALAIPAIVAAFCTHTGAFFHRAFGVEALLAGRSLLASLRRTSVLVGALSTAIAMMAAVGIMVGSFRQTVVVWMDNQLQADLYLRPAGAAGADRHPSLSPGIASRIAALPQVEAVDSFRAYEIGFDGLPATLGATDMRVAARFGRTVFLGHPDPARIYAQLQRGNFVIVSEPFANKHRLGTGDTLTLALGGRNATFRILGVYYDYASERGYILMDRSTLLRYLPDPAPSNVAVYLKPGVSLEAGRRAVEAACAGLRVHTFANRTLRTEAIRIFDRTFAITYALEAVAIVVAVLGVAGALLALVIDRRRELGLLRFLGSSTLQLRRLILFEAGFLGLLACAVGLALGSALSLILIYVINKQSFGWTIQFHWPIAVLAGALSIVFAATVLSGLYPARVAMRLNPIEVVHEE